jgi:hypothetical protein
MSQEKSNTEILCNNLLDKINREVKISKVLDEIEDQSSIDKIADEWIELMKKSLEKYQ